MAVLASMARNKERLDPKNPLHAQLLFHFRFRIVLMLLFVAVLMFNNPEHSYVATWYYQYMEGAKKEEQSADRKKGGDVV
jgi:hypothetical protein